MLTGELTTEESRACLTLWQEPKDERGSDGSTDRDSNHVGPPALVLIAPVRCRPFDGSNDGTGRHDEQQRVETAEAEVVDDDRGESRDGPVGDLDRSVSSSRRMARGPYKHGKRHNEDQPETKVGK